MTTPHIDVADPTGLIGQHPSMSEKKNVRALSSETHGMTCCKPEGVAWYAMLNHRPSVTLYILGP